MTEVKPKNSRYSLKSREFNIEGYNVHGCNRENKLGRGVILYAHKSLDAIPFEPKVKFQESVWLKIKLNKYENMIVDCIYGSDSGSSENNERLREQMREVVGMNHTRMLIMGDFNYRDINWSNWTCRGGIDSEEFKFTELVKDCSLYQHVSQYTRGRMNNEPSLIDLVMSREERMVF